MFLKRKSKLFQGEPNHHHWTFCRFYKKFAQHLWKYLKSTIFSQICLKSTAFVQTLHFLCEIKLDYTA